MSSATLPTLLCHLSLSVDCIFQKKKCLNLLSLNERKGRRRTRRGKEEKEKKKKPLMEVRAIREKGKQRKKRGPGKKEHEEKQLLFLLCCLQQA